MKLEIENKILSLKGPNIKNFKIKKIKKKKKKSENPNKVL
jgi:hypothetical protein